MRSHARNLTFMGLVFFFLIQRWEYLIFICYNFEYQQNRSLSCFWKSLQYAQWPVDICTLSLRLLFSSIMGGCSWGGKVLLVSVEWRGVFQHDCRKFTICRTSPFFAFPRSSSMSSQQPFPHCLAKLHPPEPPLCTARAVIAHLWLPCLFLKQPCSLTGSLGALYQGVCYFSTPLLSLNLALFSPVETSAAWLAWTVLWQSSSIAGIKQFLNFLAVGWQEMLHRFAKRSYYLRIVNKALIC